jgi:hypothetical protein
MARLGYATVMRPRGHLSPSNRRLELNKTWAPASGEPSAYPRYSKGTMRRQAPPPTYPLIDAKNASFDDVFFSASCTNVIASTAFIELRKC